MLLQLQFVFIPIEATLLVTLLHCNVFHLHISGLQQIWLTCMKPNHCYCFYESQSWQCFQPNVRNQYCGMIMFLFIQHFVFRKGLCQSSATKPLLCKVFGLKQDQVWLLSDIIYLQFLSLTVPIFYVHTVCVVFYIA